MSRKPKPPTVSVAEVRPRQVMIICPYCKRRHFHGWRKGEEIGHRVAHCRTGPRNVGYNINTPKEKE